MVFSIIRATSGRRDRIKVDEDEEVVGGVGDVALVMTLTSTISSDTLDDSVSSSSTSSLDDVFSTDAFGGSGVLITIGSGAGFNSTFGLSRTGLDRASLADIYDKCLSAVDALVKGILFVVALEALEEVVLLDELFALYLDEGGS